MLAAFLLLLAQAAPVSGGASLKETSVASFEFLDPGTLTPLVRGEERTLAGGSTVVKKTSYRTATGLTPLQTEECRYNGRTLVVATYHYEDAGSGEMVDLKVASAKAQVTYRASHEDHARRATIDWTPTSHTGKELPDLILHNWERIGRGDNVYFELYVPFRLETIGFRAIRAEASIREPQATKPVTIRIEPRNWFIRQVAPSIAFTFDAAIMPPHLVRYDGPSPVDIHGERNRKVVIRF